MAKPSVADFLAGLEHGRKPEIERLRAAILGADPSLGEQIKWNAPSFGRDGEDRITFRLQPGDRVELIFHRGATAKTDKGFVFDDPSGLLKMVAPDRGVVSFANASDTAAKAEALPALVRAWLAATA